MLTIHTEDKELWDEEKEQFYYISGCTFNLEHSLLSISEWEKKYHKSFINTDNKTKEETLDYIKMMIVDGNGDPDELIKGLSEKQFEEIGRYINDPMTATTISEEEENEISKKGSSHKFTTSEEIYSWMCAQNIPFECEKWHLNRLIILIKLCAISNKPKDKKKKRMTSSDLAMRRAKMDAARAKFASKK